MTEQLDVLVVGDLNPDLLVSGADLAPRWGQAERDAEMRLVLGGSAGIAAAGMARIGLRTALCATIGDDDFGVAARRMLVEHGVETTELTTVAGSRTGLSIHLLAGDDRAIYTERGAMVALTAADATAAIERRRPRHVHLAAVYLLPALARDGGAIVDAAHAAKATVSVDTNFDPDERFELPAWLTSADALLPNATEALRLTGRDATTAGDDAGAALAAAAAELAAGGALVAVKQGAQGAFALGGARLPFPGDEHGDRAEIAVPSGIAAFADAVGAGDSFDAGIVRALVDGRPLRDALAFACAAGTLSTRAAGGTAAQATLDEAATLAKELLR
ncbi:carbohydrate kinase family protein [Conexibacter sp. JD483]|uniref:carbohydrate kinase family protein n=1 Tax=unclassified Conexibacter TaxID=2627773 RepID=UPI00271605C1|nr:MULTISPECIES: carbohydrate kinase family protein [unclassified Conexibacter]MDO8184268.1 carbohydrate kinase family protein [Conexibacter sp. CPCC 205706]MDO8197574.1 carbohydrate kinase family protein [Conexibacter sp. CPCC 205762]MDR9371049.1 carbohydrate kinase family protein [Conexibacter sp. JD483]